MDPYRLPTTHQSVIKKSGLQAQKVTEEATTLNPKPHIIIPTGFSVIPI